MRGKEYPLRVLLAKAGGSQFPRTRTTEPCLWSSRLGSAGKKHEIEDVEHRISIAVKNSKLFKSQRPAEFIKQQDSSSDSAVAV